MPYWLAVSFAAVALAEPPSAKDFLTLRSVGQPAISPTAETWVFREGGRSFDPEADSEGDTDGGWSRVSQLYALDARGQMRQLTRGEDSPGDAKWAPSGDRIAFSRSVDDESALHILPIAGGEASVIDLGDLDAGSWAWQSDEQLAFTATEPEEEDAEWALDGVFSWDEQFDNALLYTVTLGSEPEAITDGERHIASFSWSAAAQAFVVTESPSADPYVTLASASLVLLRDGMRTVLSESPPCLGDYTWSPDGSHIAWAACEKGISVAHRVNVYRINDGKTWRIAEDLDPTVASLHWSPDGKSLLARVAERTETRIYRLPVAGGASRDIGFSGGEIRSMAVGPKGKWAAVRYASDHQPTSIGRLNLKNGDVAIVRDPNPHVSEWSLGDTEVVTWNNGDIALEGLLTRPPGADGPTPLLVLPHGGPDSVSTIGFSSWSHFFSTRGYAVFRPNYQGGTAYGTPFYEANRGQLGAIEFGDIETGVDALIAEKLADPDALFYGGWSWGGFLTAWTIGHTDRYRAAVAGAAVVDVVNQYVMSDINHGVVADWEYNGRPWKDLGNFDGSDPSRFLAAVTTPTLILHGDADRRVPFSQGLTLFRALSDLGVETDLVVYPGQGHGLRSGAHNAHRLKTWVAWYDAHLEKK